MAKLLERAGLNGNAIDEVIAGQVVSGGVGQAPARQAMRLAGIPDSEPALTIAVATSSWSRMKSPSREIRTGFHRCGRPLPPMAPSAGNASSINDGAAFVLLASGGALVRHNLQAKAQLLSYATFSMAPISSPTLR